MSLLSRFFCAGLLALAAGSAAAQDATPLYIGASVALGSNYAVDCQVGEDCHKHTGSGGKIFAGYTLGSSRLFGLDLVHALELSIFEVGHMRVVTPGIGYMDTSVLAGTLSYAPALKLAQDWWLTSRVGVEYAHTTSYFVDYADRYAQSYNAHDAIGATAGVGLAYAVDQHWSLRADADYLPFKRGSNGPQEHANMMSAGVGYHF